MQTDTLKNLLSQKVESFSTEQKKQYKVIELYKIINKLSKSLKNSDQQQTVLRLLKKTIDAISPRNPEPSDEFLSSYQALRQHFFMDTNMILKQRQRFIYWWDYFLESY
jgi:leucyl-tRNA synthetase